MAGVDVMPVYAEDMQELLAAYAERGRDACDFDYPPGTAPCMCRFSATGDSREPLTECYYHKGRTAERDRLRREWQRECEDTNLLLQGLGLAPCEHRSEGGSLLHGRILHTVRKVRDERDRLATELAEARGLLQETLEWPIPISFAEDARAFLSRTEGAGNG